MAGYNDEHENEYDIRVDRGDLRIVGVSRDAENPKALVLSLSREATDDELRTIHDMFRVARFDVRGSRALQ